jgi:hypothetical protein
MGCCDKTKSTVRRVAKKAANIVKGNIRAMRAVKYEFTDDRVRECQNCEQNYWIGRSLWCRLCKCYIPAKARVEDEQCPLGKWDRKGTDNGNENVGLRQRRRRLAGGGELVG